MLEEEEWGQLGVLQQIDSGTQFALNSLYRVTSRKDFVKQDCSKRFSRAMLRKSVGLPGNYGVGVFVMYCKSANAEQPGDEWCGPARITGLDKNVPWLIHSGIPITGAMHLIRPANKSEMLAYQVMSRNLTPM